MVRWARRTEGRLLLLLATVVVVGLATGLTGAVQVSARGGLLDEVAGRSGPLTVAAVEVYQALSDADATSVSAFLTGGAESTDLRARYLGDIARANAALSTAATGAATGESAARVAELANYVPTYTGLVATARAYSRQGHPLGATYLRMASELVRTTMLPAAQRLYQIEAARLAASQARAGEPPWAALTLSVLLIGCLVGVQIYLKRRTRRLLNLGLLPATALSLAGMIWLAAGTAASASRGEASQRDGTGQIEPLVQARITGLQARSDEAMTLVARGNGAVFDQHFDDATRQLTGEGGLLNQAKATVDQPETRDAVEAATGAAQRWLAMHTELRKRDTEGNYTEAVRMATDPGPASTGSLAMDLDRLLGQAIEQANDRFYRATSNAREALSGLAAGMAVFCALAVGAAVVGMWPRIAEYR